MRRRTMLVLAAGAWIGACRKKKPPTRAQPAQPAPRGWSETGIASWYGVPYHGRRAANGEIYDMEKMTAAHKTLPFQSMVKVTSLTNGKSVTVRITDRGPFIEGRIIDLSKAAAREIDMIGPGIMKVKIEVLGAATVAPAGARFGVQVGAFNERKRAERVKKTLEQQYEPVRVVGREGSSTQWRVIVGEKRTQQEAFELAAELQRSYREAFVVRIDETAGQP